MRMDLPNLRQDHLIWLDTSGLPAPGTVVPCLMCTKPFLMPKYAGEPDQVCPECKSTYDECARLVCHNCRATIGRIEPGVIDCGYYVRPRAVLHVDHCNTCRPGLPASTVIEIAKWEKIMRPGKLILPSFITPSKT